MYNSNLVVFIFTQCIPGVREVFSSNTPICSVGAARPCNLWAISIAEIRPQNHKCLPPNHSKLKKKNKSQPKNHKTIKYVLLHLDFYRNMSSVLRTFPKRRKSSFNELLHRTFFIVDLLKESRRNPYTGGIN